MRTPRLIALDMDGTLLDGDGRVPDAFWPLLETARSRGITLAPASGRQLATLQQMFPECDTFIAENGSVVVHDNRVISATTLPSAAVRAAMAALHSVETPHTVVLCTPDTAYVHKGADEQARARALHIFETINEPNLLDNVLPTRGRATLVLTKGADHQVRRIRLRKL